MNPAPFKDHTTKEALKNVRPYIKRLVELTATPAAESMSTCSPRSTCSTQAALRPVHHPLQRKYFVESKSTRKLDLRPGAKEAITRKIHDICLWQ